MCFELKVEVVIYDLILVSPECHFSTQYSDEESVSIDSDLNPTYLATSLHEPNSTSLVLLKSHAYSLCCCLIQLPASQLNILLVAHVA
jgi:hypothetical protein